MKPLIYPFTYEEWLTLPRTKKALKQIKIDCEIWRKEKKYGQQLEINYV